MVNQQKECSKDASLIYNAPKKLEAIKQFRLWRTKWQRIDRDAVHCLEKELSFFNCPEGHRVGVYKLIK